MVAMQELPPSLTPREAEQMNYEKEMFEKQAAFQLEMARLEAKFSSWLKIPKWIILLPVYLLFGIAYIIAVARKHEPSENFWKFLK